MSESVSVIIPALNEERQIGATIERMRVPEVEEVILVDGGSDDSTVQVAESLGARVVHGPANRGRQQNLGAQHASGSILLFLHADTALPLGFVEQVRATLARPGTSAGAFRFRLDGTGWRIRMIERLVALRCWLFRLPYGDQAIFVSRAMFVRAGQFADMPAMEDFDLIWRLRKLGRIGFADGDAVTSARRWRRFGILRVWWRHQLCILGYFLGVSPQRLARWRDPSWVGKP